MHVVRCETVLCVQKECATNDATQSSISTRSSLTHCVSSELPINPLALHITHTCISHCGQISQPKLPTCNPNAHDVDGLDSVHWQIVRLAARRGGRRRRASLLRHVPADEGAGILRYRVVHAHRRLREHGSAHARRVRVFACHGLSHLQATAPRRGRLQRRYRRCPSCLSCRRLRLQLRLRGHAGGRGSAPRRDHVAHAARAAAGGCARHDGRRWARVSAEVEAIFGGEGRVRRFGGRCWRGRLSLARCAAHSRSAARHAKPRVHSPCNMG